MRHQRYAPARRLILALLALLPLAHLPFAVARAAETPPRLSSVNAFKKPEEVVGYYCARDAAGFVWTGLLDAERKAFTLWREAPQHDSFQVARGYKILPAKIVNSTGTEAEVEVEYEMMGTSDANGTWVPAALKESRVKFALRKVNGAWRIHSPSPEAISPVVVHGKFPYKR